jgi:hypothetical protein
MIVKLIHPNDFWDVPLYFSRSSHDAEGAEWLNGARDCYLQLEMKLAAKKRAHDQARLQEQQLPLFAEMDDATIAI